MSDAPEQVAAGATKWDGEKVPLYQAFDSYFPHATLAVAWVGEYGFRKYGRWGGWRKVVDGIMRYTNAKRRHAALQDLEGPYDDSDSGLAHAAQEAWNAMARLELLIVEGKVDIRRGNEIEFRDGKPYPVLGTSKKVHEVAKSA